MRNDFLNIWVVGTYANQLDGIGVDLYKCRYVTTEDIEGENINHLSRFVNEFVCQWYVYKNNIKSDYVAFCHYRRQKSITDILFPQIKNGYIQYFYALYLKNSHLNMRKKLPFMTRNIYMPQFMMDDIIEYLYSQKIIPIDKIEKFCSPLPDKPLVFPCREIYACNWENFCNMMEFICGYYEFICEKYHLKTREDWVEHIKNNVIEYHKSFGRNVVNTYFPYSVHMIYQRKEDYLRIFDEDGGLNSFCNNWRVYAYVIEDLIGLYIGTHKRTYFGELTAGNV